MSTVMYSALLQSHWACRYIIDPDTSEIVIGELLLTSEYLALLNCYTTNLPFRDSGRVRPQDLLPFRLLKYERETNRHLRCLCPTISTYNPLA